jgi:hypothetical protein
MGLRRTQDVSAAVKVKDDVLGVGFFKKQPFTGDTAKMLLSGFDMAREATKLLAPAREAFANPDDMAFFDFFDIVLWAEGSAKEPLEGLGA